VNVQQTSIETAGLDRIYTELAEAIERVGPESRTLFLSTLALALLIEEGCSKKGLDLIAQAERVASL
jgi:hypothetical protein